MVSIVAMALGLGAALAGVMRLRRTSTALSVDPVEIADAIGREGDRKKVEAVAIALREEGAHWEAALLDALLHPVERVRVAWANEALDDLARELEWGRELPTSAVRISVLGALCIVFATAATGNAAAETVLHAVAWGGAGITIAVLSGREAKRIATSVREGVDMLIDRVDTAAKRSNDPSPISPAGVDPEPAGV